MLERTQVHDFCSDTYLSQDRLWVAPCLLDTPRSLCFVSNALTLNSFFIDNKWLLDRPCPQRKAWPDSVDGTRRWSTLNQRTDQIETYEQATD